MNTHAISIENMMNEREYLIEEIIKIRKLLFADRVNSNSRIFKHNFYSNCDVLELKQMIKKNKPWVSHLL